MLFICKLFFQKSLEQVIVWGAVNDFFAVLADNEQRRRTLNLEFFYGLLAFFNYVLSQFFVFETFGDFFFAQAVQRRVFGQQFFGAERKSPVALFFEQE